MSVFTSSGPITGTRFFRDEIKRMMTRAAGKAIFIKAEEGNDSKRKRAHRRQPRDDDATSPTDGVVAAIVEPALELIGEGRGIEERRIGLIGERRLVFEAKQSKLIEDSFGSEIIRRKEVLKEIGDELEPIVERARSAQLWNEDEDRLHGFEQFVDEFEALGMDASERKVAFDDLGLGACLVGIAHQAPEEDAAQSCADGMRLGDRNLGIGGRILRIEVAPHHAHRKDLAEFTLFVFPDPEPCGKAVKLEETGHCWERNA